MGGVIVDSAVYGNGHRLAGSVDLSGAAPPLAARGEFAWIGLFEPTKLEFAQVRRCFALPDLAVEDALGAHQRPKLEQYDDCLFMVLKTARYLDPSEEVEFGEIQVFVGPGFVVHVRHHAPSNLVGVRRAIEQDPDRLRLGPGAVLHAIVDRVVDNYEPVVDGLANDIDEVEREVFTRRAGESPVERIYRLMRTVLEVLQDLAPLLGPLDDLSRKRYDVIHEDLQEYFRDVHDHLARLVAQVHTFKELLTNVLTANLTRVSIRQNQDMRKISAWVAIAAVPTMVAGIYGMNFEHMPELRWPLAYPVLLVTLFVLCFALYRRFKREEWL